MEIFIYIPYNKYQNNCSVYKIIKNDFMDSYKFIRDKKPVFFEVMILVSVFNLVLSSVIIVGIPILITEVLKMSNTMYGFTQGALALGGLCGGFLAEKLSAKLKNRNLYLLLLVCSFSVAIMGISIFFKINYTVQYFIITFMGFIIMGVSTLFVVQVYTAIQLQTPHQLVGKIMSVLISVAMCGQPIGQAIYGILFDIFSHSPWAVLSIASAFSLFISLYSKHIFINLENSKNYQDLYGV